MLVLTHNLSPISVQSMASDLRPVFSAVPLLVLRLFGGLHVSAFQRQRRTHLC